MSKMNNLEQFGLSRIMFKQSVFSSQRSQCDVLNTFCIYRHLSTTQYSDSVVHPDIHRTLSRYGLHCCNQIIYVSCKGFHYCKNILLVSANRLVQGVSLGRVVGKKCWVHLPMTIKMLVDAFPTDLAAYHSARMSPEGAPGTFPLNASFVEGR